MDADGYPTEDELEKIKTWGANDYFGWFEFIKTCWWAADWGWSEEDGTERFSPNEPVHWWRISTGGWSGNESVIAAMLSTKIAQGGSGLWDMAWYSTRRGGHYEFLLPLPKAAA